jgi:hypothetical protein
MSHMQWLETQFVLLKLVTQFCSYPLQVSGAVEPPHFRLHIQPGSPAQPGNGYARTISHAGEGKGLQVFPGSVAELTGEVGW